MNIIDIDGRLVTDVGNRPRRREFPPGPLPPAVVLVLRDAIILGLNAEGYSYVQIGQLLNICRETVCRRIKLASRADDGMPNLADPDGSPLRMTRWS